MFAEQERHLSETFSGAEEGERLLFSLTHLANQPYAAATNGEHAVAGSALTRYLLGFTVRPHLHQTDKLGKLRGGQMKAERKPRGFEFRFGCTEVDLRLRIIAASTEP